MQILVDMYLHCLFYISVYEVHLLGQIQSSKFKTCVPKMYF